MKILTKIFILIITILLFSNFVLAKDIKLPSHIKEAKVTYTETSLEQPFLIKRIQIDTITDTSFNGTFTVGFNGSMKSTDLPNNPILLYVNGSADHAKGFDMLEDPNLNIYIDSETDEKTATHIMKKFTLSKSNIAVGWNTIKDVNFSVDFNFNLSNGQNKILTLGWGTGSTIITFNSSSANITGSSISGTAIWNTSKDNISTSWRTDSTKTWHTPEPNLNVVDRWTNSRKTNTEYWQVASSSARKLDIETNNYTWMGWWKTDVSGNIGYFNKYVNDKGYSFYSESAGALRKFRFYLANTTHNVTLELNISADNVNWRHMTIVLVRNQNASFYINGTLYGGVDISAFQDSNITATTDAFQVPLGTEKGTGNNYNFGGDHDEFYAYSRALTSTEISAAYNNGINGLVSNVSNTNLVLYLDYNGESIDRSSNALPVTSSGSSWFSTRSDTNNFPETVYCFAEANGLSLIDATTNTYFMGATKGKGWLGNSGFQRCDAYNGKIVATDGSAGLNIMDLNADRLYLFNTSGMYNYSTNVSRRDESDAYGSLNTAFGSLSCTSLSDMRCTIISGHQYCAMGCSGGGTGTDILNMSSLKIISNGSSTEGAGSVGIDIDGDLWYTTGGGSANISLVFNVLGGIFNFKPNYTKSIGSIGSNGITGGNGKGFLFSSDSSGSLVLVYNKTLGNPDNYTGSDNIFLDTSGSARRGGFLPDNETLIFVESVSGTSNIIEINTTSAKPRQYIGRNATHYTSISGSVGAWLYLDSTVTDQISSDNTLKNATSSFITGKVGSAFNVSASRPNITYSSDLALEQNNFTIQFWYNYDSCGGSCSESDMLFTGSSSGYLSVGIDSNSRFFYEQYNGTLKQRVTGATTTSSSSWQNYAIVKNGTTIILYYNGVQDNKTELANYNLTFANLDWNIGQNATKQLFVNGSVDEIRIIQTYLNSSQIDTDYKNYIPDSSTKFSNYASWDYLDIDASNIYNLANSDGIYLFVSSSGSTSQAFALSWGVGASSDTTNPTITINNPLNNTFWNANFVVNATVTDDTAVSIVKYRWQNSTFNSSYVTIALSANNFYNATQAISELVDGNYTLRIDANDSSYNNATAFGIFVVDTTNPTLTLNAPTNNTYSNSRWVLFNGSSNDTNFANISIYIDNVLNTTNSSGGLTYYTFNLSLSDASHTWYMLTTDRIGNTNQSATRTIIVDTSSPGVNFETPTPPSVTTYQTTLFIPVNVTATDTNLANITIFLYNSTGQVFRNVSGSSPFLVNYTGLVEGNYTINATANDSAGNEASTTSRNIFIDLTNPTLVLNAPSNNSWTNNATILFNVTATDGISLDAARLYIDNLFNQTSGGGNGVKTWTVTLSEGSHTWFVNASDSAGNNNISTTRTINVDSLNPSVVLSSPINGYNETSSLTINFIYNISDTNLQACRLYHNESGTFSIEATNTTPTNNLNNTFSETFVANGKYLWNVACNDSAGNLAYASSNRTLNISYFDGNAAPTINSVTITPSTAYTNDSLVCNFNISDPESNPVYVNVTWYKGNTTWTADNQNNINITQNNLVNVTNATGNIEANNTFNSNQWICQVTADDLNNTVVRLNSSALTISNYSTTLITTNQTNINLGLGAVYTFNYSSTSPKYDLGMVLLNFTPTGLTSAGDIEFIDIDEDGQEDEFVVSIFHTTHFFNRDGTVNCSVSAITSASELLALDPYNRGYKNIVIGNNFGQPSGKNAYPVVVNMSKGACKILYQDNASVFDLADNLIEGDFDLDGNDDDFLLNSRGEGSQVYTFDGTNWSRYYRISSGLHPTIDLGEMMIIDYNQDGQKELLTTHKRNTTILNLTANGTTISTKSENKYGRAIETIDFDRTGNKDNYVVSQGNVLSSGWYIQAYWKNGTQRWRLNPLGGSNHEFIPIDYKNSGYKDHLLTGDNQGIEVWNASGKIIYTDYSSNKDRLNNMEREDINDDATQEIVVGGGYKGYFYILNETAQIQVYWKNPNGVQWGEGIQPQGKAKALAFTDWDNDGVNDIGIIAKTGNSYILRASSCFVTYDDNTTEFALFNLSSGLFQTTKTYSSSGTHTLNVTCKYGGYGTQTTTLSSTILADTTSPTITLLSPTSGSTQALSSVDFIFNVSDNVGFGNCSLFTNESGTFALSQTDTSITNNANNTIADNLNNNQNYLWGVRCYDVNSNLGWSSSNFSLRIGFSENFTQLTNVSGINLTTEKEGIAWSDLDKDGDLDLIVSTLGNVTGSVTGMYLYRNLGNFNFTNYVNLSGGGAIILGDFDNDGDLDLASPRAGGIIYSNNGTGTFTEVGGNIIKFMTYGQGAVFFDYNNDSYLDIFMPGLNTSNWALFNNTGATNFNEVSISKGFDLNDLGFDQLADYATTGDFDNDGDLDLVVRGNNYQVGDITGNTTLWRYYSNGTFIEESDKLGIYQNSTDVSGLAFRDYDLDGDLDLYIGRYGENNEFYEWNGTYFVDMCSNLSICGDQDTLSIAWGDYNNDGYDDLYVVNNGTDKLYRNNGNRSFTEIGSSIGLGNAQAGQGALFADIDNDCDQDLHTLIENQIDAIYQNNINNGNCLKIIPIGFYNTTLFQSNVWGSLGAKVRVYNSTNSLVCYQEIDGGSGRGSQNPQYAYCGLNETNNYTVNVTFTSGIVVTQSNIIPNNRNITFGSTTIQNIMYVNETARNSTTSPTVTLQSPANASNTTNSFILLQADVSHSSTINCTIFGDQNNPPTTSLNTTNNITVSTNLTYNWTSFSYGTNYWAVNCTDSSLSTFSQRQFTSLANSSTFTVSYPESITRTPNPKTETQVINISISHGNSRTTIFNISVLNDINTTYFTENFTNTNLTLSQNVVGYFQYNIYINSNVTNGDYRGNLSFTVRNDAVTTVYRIPVLIHIVDSAAEVIVLDSTGVNCDSSSSCNVVQTITETQSITKDYILKNNGNIEASNCKPYLTNISSVYYDITPSVFNLPILSEQTITVILRNFIPATYRFELDANCTVASNTISGLTNTLPFFLITVNEAEGTITPPPSPPPEENGGGGGGGDEVTTIVGGYGFKSGNISYTLTDKRKEGKTDYFIARGQERKTDLIVTNIGKEDIKIKIGCENILGNLCANTNFKPNEIELKVNESKLFTAFTLMPLIDKETLQYKYNILANAVGVEGEPIRYSVTGTVSPLGYVYEFFDKLKEPVIWKPDIDGAREFRLAVGWIALIILLLGGLLFAYLGKYLGKTLGLSPLFITVGLVISFILVIGIVILIT